MKVILPLVDLPELPDNWRLINRNYAAATYRSRNGLLVIISSAYEDDNKPWLHLSVSRRKKLPSWEDLVRVKKLFLGSESLAIQVLPPRSEYVNFHPYCLHLFVCLEDRPVPDFRTFGGI